MAKKITIRLSDSLYERILRYKEANKLNYLSNSEVVRGLIAKALKFAELGSDEAKNQKLGVNKNELERDCRKHYEAFY